MGAGRFPIHVCLVSEQATPNFIPALDHRTRPHEVVLIVSDKMQDQARWLTEAFRARNIVVTQHAISDPWDVASVQESLLELLATREHDDLALNVTGGTKPMAIAAQEVFGSAKRPVFYVHPDRNELVPLFGAGEPMRIEERVRLAEYLAIHGYEEIERDRTEYTESHHFFCDELVKEVERFGDQLRRLNLLAQQAVGRLHADLHAWKRDDRLCELLDKLERYGIATLEGNLLRFADERARFFANGGWLEVYVARVLESLSTQLGIQDSARSLVVQAPAGSRNEVDVGFLAGNRLYLIECKARRMTATEERDPGTEALYKLDSLTAMGGLNTRGMLVSYQAMEQPDRNRARQLRIRIVERGELRNLAKHLRDWVTEKT